MSRESDTANVDSPILEEGARSICTTGKRWYTFIDHSGAQDQMICETLGELPEGFIYVMNEELAKRRLSDTPYMNAVRELRLNAVANKITLGCYIGIVADKDVTTVRVFDLFEDHVHNLEFTEPWRKDSLLDIILTGREDLFEELQAKTPIDFDAMGYSEICELTCAATMRNSMWFLKLIAQKLDKIPYTAELNRSSISGVSATRFYLLDYWADLYRTGKLVCIDRYSFVEKKLRIYRVGALKRTIQYIEEFELGQAEVDYVVDHVMLNSMVHQRIYVEQVGDIYSLTKYSPPEQAQILGLSRYKLPDLFTCKIMLESTGVIYEALRNPDADYDALEVRSVMKTQLDVFFTAEQKRIGSDALSVQIWQLLNWLLNGQPEPENAVITAKSALHYHEALVALIEVVPLNELVKKNVTEFFDSAAGRAWFDRSIDIWQFDFILALFRRLGRTLSSDMLAVSKFQVYAILEWWGCAVIDFPGVVQFNPTNDMLKRCVLTYSTRRWWEINIDRDNFTAEQLRTIKVCGVPLGYVADHSRGDDLLRLFTVCNKEEVINPSILFSIFRKLDIAVTLDNDLCDLMVIMGEELLLRHCVHELSSRPAQITSRVNTELSTSLTGLLDSQSISHLISRRVAFLSRGYEIELSLNAPTSGKTGSELYWEARAQFQNEIPTILSSSTLPSFIEYNVFDYDDGYDDNDGDIDTSWAIELSTRFTPVVIRTVAKAQRIIAGFSHPESYSPTDVCVLCLEALGSDSAALVQTPCGHNYHNTAECNLIAHLVTSNMCPLCRAAITD